jgi:hypothetical protein
MPNANGATPNVNNTFWGGSNPTMPGVTLPNVNGTPVMPIMGSQVYGNIPSFNQTQVVSDQTIKINPQVMQLVSPIIETMTQYDMFQKSSPAFGMWYPKNSLDDYQKKRFEEAKKNCVHLIRDINNGQLVPTLEEFDDSKFKCRLCGRLVYKKFDKSAVDIILDSVAVLNMLAFFGMSLNISAEQMSKIIFIKSSMKEINELVGMLNKFVKEEDSAISSGSGNIGEASRNAEFRTGQMLGFNGF